MELDILNLVERGGALVLLAIVLVLMIGPALRRLGNVHVTLQRQADLLERLVRSYEGTQQQLVQNNQDTQLLRRAIRVAFAGRSNGHTWEEAKKHYAVAANLLADDESDELLAGVNDGTSH